MKKYINSLTHKATQVALILIACCTIVTTTACAKDVYDSYQTKFGELTQDYQSTSFYMNGQLLLAPPITKGAYGEDQKLSYEVADIDVKKNKKNMTIARLITSYDSGGCHRQFIVLDFTGSKPYISKPFGYNPDGTACLKLDKVKWGKDISYIYLEGPMKYAYHTGGAVIGPLE